MFNLKTLSGAEAVVEILKQEQVKHLFTLPGTTILPLFHVLAHEPNIETIVTRHEQGAVHMAEGYARAGEKVGVCLASRGPGLTNMSIGLHNAYDSSSPVVAIIGSIATDIYNRDAFEELDILTFSRPLTKWVVEVQKADRIPELLSRGIHISRVSRPRPVVIAIPEDLLHEKVEMAFLDKRETYRSLPCADEESIYHFFALLMDSKRPLILAGGGLHWGQAAYLLEDFVDKTQIPVICTHGNKGSFSNHHRMFRGTITQGGATTKSTFDYIHGADLLISLGCNFSQFTTRRYTLFRNCPLIQVDIDPLEMGKIYPPTISIQADVSMLLSHLISHIIGDDLPFNWDWPDSYGEDYQKETYLQGPFPEKPINPGQVVYELKRLLKEDALVFFDSGSFRKWFERYYPFSPKTFFSPGGGCMGYGIPAALGGKLACPHKDVICITGDGGALMVIQELETAVRYQIPVLIIVMNNFSYGNPKMHQKRMYDGCYFGVDMGNPDFSLLGQSFGLYSQRVEVGGQIRDSLQRALNHKGPSLIEIIVDPHLIQPL